MKYDHSVIYGKKLYRAGEEVPISTKKKTASKASALKKQKAESGGEDTPKNKGNQTDES